MSWNQLASILKRGAYDIVLCVCVIGLYGCSIPNFDLSGKGLPNFDVDLPIIGELGNPLEEVSPPELIQQLKQDLSASAPVVEILEPLENSTIETQNVEFKWSVSGLDIYKDNILGLGPHIAVVLDEQAPLEVYDIKQPVIFKNLKPGTHTVRAIAEYPWHESFKNQSAYAQRSFNILTPSQQHRVGDSPVLTVSSIQDRYTSEPILLDFVVRQATSKGEGDRKITTPKNLKVKVTLNDQTFVIDEANSSLYLEGLKSGQNWIKLDLENFQGQSQTSPFSEQTFGFQFEPGKSSPLGKLFSEQISLEDAGGIVGHPKPVPQPTAVDPQSIKPSPKVLPPTQDPRPSPSIPAKPSQIKPESAPSDLKTKTPPRTSDQQSITPTKALNPIKDLPSTSNSKVPVSSPHITSSSSEEQKKSAPTAPNLKSKPISSPTQSLTTETQSDQSPESRDQSTTTPSQAAPSQATPLNQPGPSQAKDTPQQISQGLANWRDRFRQLKTDATSQSKLAGDEPSTLSPSSQAPKPLRADQPTNLSTSVQITP